MRVYKVSLLPNVLLTTAVVFFSVSVFSPVGVYYSNLLEFQNFAWEVILLGVVIASILTLLCGVLLSAALKRLSKSVRDRVLCLFMSVGLGLFLQGTYLGWSAGPLDGGAVNWSAPLPNFLGLLMWSVVIFAPQTIRGLRSFTRVRAVCSVLLITQGAIVAVNSVTVDEFRELKTYKADMSPFFDFSSERNVIVLIVDEFQCDVFADIVEVEPSLLQSFEGFTFFSNTLAPSRHTFPSIPAMLTGVRYDNSVPIPTYLEKAYLDNSLLKQLVDNDIRTEVFPTIPGTIYVSPEVTSNAVSREFAFEEYRQLVEFGLVRTLPPIINRYAYESMQPQIHRSGLEKGEVRSFNNGIANSKLQTQQTVFKFIHLEGMHVPLKFDENLDVARLRYNRENYQRQAVGVLGVIESFLSKLKELGIYDQSLIIIAGDHGSGRTKDMWIQASDPEASEFNFDKARGCPLLLAKPLNSEERDIPNLLEVSSAPVALSDVPITIFEELGIRDLRSNSENLGVNAHSPAHFVAKSLFSVNEFENRLRTYDSYEWEIFNSVFLSTITEFMVTGDVSQDSSWQKGRQFLPLE